MLSQAISLDLMLSLAILAIAISILTFYVYSSSYIYNSNSVAYFSTNELLEYSKLSTILFSLVYSPGIPNNWTTLSCNQIKALGLLNSSNNEVSFYKMKALLNLGYQCVAEKLGVNNIGFIFTYINNSPFLINGGYEFWNVSGIGLPLEVFLYPNSTLIYISVFAK
jgi:hypothetical protein